MKIAVTGATGFIGRHVLAELSARPVEIIALVRPSADKPGRLFGAKVVPLDIHEPPRDVYESIGRPDLLLHLAWSGLPNYQSLHHFERELPAQYQFLKNLIASGLQSLLVTGTCFEYGMQSGRLSESLDTRPTNPYGFAKDMLRRQLEYLMAELPFQLTWARLFYLYGEGQSENSLLSQLRKTIARGDKTFNMSGGEQLRDYMPVREAAKHLVALALRTTGSGIVNICSGNPISVRRLVEDWIAENNCKISLNLGHFPYPDYEPMAFWGSREKLDAQLEHK